MLRCVYVRVFTAVNEVCEGYVFTCVCLSTKEGGGIPACIAGLQAHTGGGRVEVSGLRNSPGPHPGGWSPGPPRGGLSRHTLRQTPPKQTATTAGGTHPTGMHSCSQSIRTGRVGGHQRILWPNFAENCIKVKKIVREARPIFTARKRSLRRLCFYRVSVILSTGGACMVAPGRGHAWLLQGGHLWLLPGGMRGCSGGACVVAPRGVCMVAPRGACVVAPRGGVHGCSWGDVHGEEGGMHGEGGVCVAKEGMRGKGGVCMAKGGHAW